MYAQVEKPKESKSRAVANSVAQKKSAGKQGAGFVDNRPEALKQRRVIEAVQNGKNLKQLKKNDANYDQNSVLQRAGEDGAEGVTAGHAIAATTGVMAASRALLTRSVAPLGYWGLGQVPFGNYYNLGRNAMNSVRGNPLSFGPFMMGLFGIGMARHLARRGDRED
jgi:hypothetical protein